MTIEDDIREAMEAIKKDTGVLPDTIIFDGEVVLLDELLDCTCGFCHGCEMRHALDALLIKKAMGKE